MLTVRRSLYRPMKSAVGGEVREGLMSTYAMTGSYWRVCVRAARIEERISI